MATRRTRWMIILMSMLVAFTCSDGLLLGDDKILGDNSTTQSQQTTEVPTLAPPRHVPSIVDETGPTTESKLPTITKFTIGQTTAQDFTPTTVRRHGATPTMYCSASSPTRPMTVEIVIQGAGKTMTQELGSEATLKLEPLKCSDSDTYLCITRNEFGSQNVSMDLTVLCPPQFLLRGYNNTPDIDSPVYTGRVGSPLTVTVDILSSPPPRRIELRSVNIRKRIAYRDLTSEVDDSDDDDDVQVDYVPGTPPYGTAVVDLFKLTPADIGAMYTVVVENGQEPSLLYTFLVAEDESAAAPVSKQQDGPSPSSASLWNTPVIALVAALASLILLMLAGLGWILYHRYDGGCVSPRTILDDMRSSRRQRVMLKDDMPENEPTPTPRASQSNIIDYSLSYSGNSGHVQDGIWNNAYTNTSRSNTSINSQTGDSIQVAHLRSSKDYKKRASNGSRKSARSERKSNGADSNNRVSVDQELRDIYVNVDEDKRSSRESSQVSPLSPATQKSIATGCEIETEPMSISNPVAQESSSEDTNVNSHASPEAAMSEAEKKMEWAVPGQHRKLSLPREDTIESSRF